MWNRYMLLAVFLLIPLTSTAQQAPLEEKDVAPYAVGGPPANEGVPPGPYSVWRVRYVTAGGAKGPYSVNCGGVWAVQLTPCPCPFNRIEEQPIGQIVTSPLEQLDFEEHSSESFEISSYPNPFNPTTTIQFTLPEATHVSLIIYDMLGREVKRLVEGPLATGEHSIPWDASGLPSGMYLYRIQAGNFTATNHIVLAK